MLKRQINQITQKQHNEHTYLCQSAKVKANKYGIAIDTAKDTLYQIMLQM
jgi:hypothetical protein